MATQYALGTISPITADLSRIPPLLDSVFALEPKAMSTPGVEAMWNLTSSSVPDHYVPGSIHEKSADQFGVKFEIQHLQSLTNSFVSLIEGKDDLIQTFFSPLLSRYPGSLYSLAGFSDKPLPYLGYGPYGGLGESIEHDLCYELYTSLSPPSPSWLQDTTIKVRGGFDSMDNALGAMISGVMDRRVGWSSQPETVRVQFVFVEGLPHTGVEDIPPARRSAQSNVDAFNDEWMNETADPFLFSYGRCPVGGDLWNEGVALRKHSSSGTLTAEQEASFVSLVDECGPWPLDQMRAFSDEAFAEAFGQEGDEAKRMDLCASMEYPSFEQFAAVFHSIDNAVVPVILVAPRVGDTLLPFYHQANICSHTVREESECIASYYRDQFKLRQIPGIALAIGTGEDLLPSSLNLMNYSIDIILNYIVESRRDSVEMDVVRSPPTIFPPVPIISSDGGIDRPTIFPFKGDERRTEEVESALNDRSTLRGITNPSASLLSAYLPESRSSTRDQEAMRSAWIDKTTHHSDNK